MSLFGLAAAMKLRHRSEGFIASHLSRRQKRQILTKARMRCSAHFSLLASEGGPGS